MEEIRRRGWSLAVSIPAGAAVGILSAAGLARILGATPEVIASLAPKSTTTPISMGIAEKIGGIPPLTAALVIAAGILGAAIGPAFLRLIRVRSKTAFGLAIGAAAHGVGTARALEEGELEGAASGLAIGLTGIATAVLTPILIGLFN
jgi:putative effector of murein hydrolase